MWSAMIGDSTFASAGTKQIGPLERLREYSHNSAAKGHMLLPHPSLVIPLADSGHQSRSGSERPILQAAAHAGLPDVLDHVAHYKIIVSFDITSKEFRAQR